MSDIEEEEGNQKKQTKSINIGSIISISHFQDNNAFIFTDGHVDSEVYLKNFGNQKENTSSNRKSLLGRENFSSTLFLIYPKSSNGTKAEILKLLNKDFRGNVLDSNKSVQPLDSEQAIQYQNKLLNEYKYNYDSFEKSRSTQLSYHQVIQLLHLNSGKFLACHQDEAEYEKESFHITLDNYTSENTMFQIIPAFKFQKDGDQVIWANEITWIVRAIGIHNKTTYLHSSSEINEIQEQEQQQQSQIEKQRSNTQQVKDKTIRKREINASIEEPTSWKLNLFQEFNSQPDSYLRCGDVVWIHHSEANSILTAVRNSKGVDKYNFSSLDLDSWLSKENLVLNIQPSLRSNTYEDYSGNTFGMFMIDGKNQQEGGQIVFEKCYRFKHLSSGCYLSVIQKEAENSQNQTINNQSQISLNININKSNLTLPPIQKSNIKSIVINDKPPNPAKIKDKGTYIIKLTTVADESTLFTFFQLKTDKMNAQHNFLESGKFTYIRHWKTGRYLDIGCTLGELSQQSLKQKQQLRSQNFFPIMRQVRNESQLFKLYATTVDEIFEINYVLSCFRLLVTFVISLNKYEVKSSKDEDYLIILNQKIGLAKNCVSDLDLFVNNKLANTKPNQKFGTSNTFRQKLLLEQYYIDILVKILEDSLPKQELELWSQKDNQESQQQIIEDEEEDIESPSKKKKNEKKGIIDKKEYYEYIDNKVQLAKLIYRLIIGICKNNPTNEMYTFELIPFFQIHFKYIPESIDCLIEICSKNDQILTKFAENLKIQFDFNQKKAITDDMDSKIKFLINLYDGNEYDTPEIIKQEHIMFRQHEKLISKPINLINYFMNLIWDNDAQHKKDYLRFLASVCTTSDKGLSINQENIYKLYKKYNQMKVVIDHEKYFPDQTLMLPNNVTEKELQILSEQLNFYGSLSYGRNFLWKNELEGKIQESYLISNIWNENNDIPQIIKAKFCKLALSLFIDHDPLIKIEVPNFCRLFEKLDQKVKLFELDKKRYTMFNTLINEVLNYYQKFYDDLFKILKIKEEELKPDEKNKKQKTAAERGYDFLNDKLLLDTTEMFYILMKLNLFEILNVQQQYEKFIHYFLTLFQYHKNNLKFVSGLYMSDEERTRKRIEKKKNKMPQLNLGGLGSFMGKLNKLNKPEEKEEVSDEEIEIGLVDDGNIYFNPIMRGFIRLNNDLESVNYENSHQIQVEIQIKLRICDIINHFLDLRQDFLITNCLVWFKSVMPQQNEKNQSYKKSTVNVSAEDQEFERIQKAITEIVKQEIKGIFPNISKSGIEEIDELYAPQKDDKEDGVFGMALGRKKTTKFKNYIENKEYPEFFDIDTMLMHGLDESTIGLEESQAAIIPKMLSAFILIQNEELEKKCLRIITRIFNQRDEMRQNILKLQILFSPEQNDLFTFVEEQILQLRRFIERSEVWIQTLGDKNQDISQHDCTNINKILQNITNSLFSGCEIEKINNKNMRCILPSFLQPKLDKEKQNISKYLKTYDPILQLIKDGMSHFASYMMSNQIQEDAKILLVKMFSQAFEFLTMFVKQNPENQKILHKHLDQFTGYLRFDLGQIGLICEIYRDNMDLLISVDIKLITLFINLIEHEGRQVMFLDFFEVIQKCKNEMIFENQLLVLNQFLSLKDMSEKEIKLLYADHVKNNQVYFYLDDIASLQPQDIISKLKEVDYRDTYRDEPFLYHAKLLEIILLSTFDHGNDIAERYDFLWNTRINYNISMNKLKKCFQIITLLSILCEKDYLLNEQNKIKDQIKNLPELSKKKDDLHNHGLDFKRQGYSYIKPYIANFIRCVHILSEKTQHHSIPENNAESIEFTRLVEFELFRLERLNPPDITIEYIVYIFDYILPLFNAYYEKNFELGLLYRLGNPENRRDLKGIKQFGITLYERKQIFDNWIDSYQIQKTQEFLKRLGQRLIEYEVQPRIPEFNIENTPFEQSIADDNKADNALSPDVQPKSLLLDKNSQSQIGFSRQNKDKKSIINFKQPDRQQKLQIEQKEEIFGNPKQDAFEIFKLRLQEEELVNIEIDLEKSALADVIINIQKLVKDEYYKKLQPKPDLDLVLKKFISFLTHSMEDPGNKTTIISLLQILRKIIEKEENEVKKQELQNRFDKLGATRMVLFVISEDHPNLDGDLLINFLLFINVMLEGGNVKVQKTIYDFCVQNTKSELIFQKFNSFITKQIDSLEYKSRKKKMELAKKKIQKAGQQDQIEEEELMEEGDEEDSTIKPLDVEILSNVLNFLQMCVEGHNIQMQNYLRLQFNSRTNYDMVNAVADLVKTYYYDARTQDMFLNMIKCLDTLSELVQGPCPENQIAVSESKFFDICTDLFSIAKTETVSTSSMTMKSGKTKSGNMGSKKRTVGGDRYNAGLTQWMIERLRNKCLILVLSLLEMRDVKTETQLVKRIIRNLPMNVLEKHLDKVYKKFQRQYKGQYIQECLHHLDQDPDTVRQKLVDEKLFEKMYNNDKGYFDFIIQNGFYILFLVSYYMESNERLEGSLVQMFRAQQKKVVSKEKNFLEQLLYGDNIISQLLLFVWNIVEQSIQLGKEIQIATMKNVLKDKKDDPEVKKKLFKEKMEAKRRRMSMAFEFFFNNTAHIDVVRNNKLELVYFILLPYTKSLPKEKKTEFHEVVDRSNVKSKVQDLVNISDQYIEICKHEERLKQFFAKNQFFSIFANYVKLWKDLAFIFTLLLNLFVLLSFSTVWLDRLNEPRLFMLDSVTKDETMRIFLILGLMMTSCSMFVVVFFLLKNLPLIIEKVWDKQEAKIEKKKKQGIIDWIVKIIINFILILIQLVQEVEIIYYLSYGALAILGTFIHPFFFVFHLSEVLIRYPTLKSVIKAVYNPREQLGLTFILYLIFVYIFTLWGFVQFYADYNDECNDLYYCFLLTIDTTFKWNGGIGGWLSEQSDVDGNPVQNYGNNITRIFYDTIFNILVVIILVNIVSGIIIDTFGALRDEENEKNKDIQDKCFICGILKTTFDRQSDPNSGGFTQHIRINHYMWNYMFYITYLKWKNSDDYTGIESYAAEKLANDDFTWFPFNKARELEDMDVEGEEAEKNLIDQIQKIFVEAIGQGKEGNKRLTMMNKKEIH